MGTYTGTPRTWVAGETVTAALMNSDVRDPFLGLADSMTSYSPTMTGFTIGNGTITGYYQQVGKFVHFKVVATFGSTSAAASAVPGFSLPVTAVSSSNGPPLLTAFFIDNSPSNSYIASAIQASTTSVSIAIIGSSGLRTVPSTTTPFTWTTSDRIEVSGIYEAA